MNKDTEQELKELKALTIDIFGRIEKLIEGGVKEVIRKADKVYDKHMGNQTYISDVKSPFKSKGAKGAKSKKVTVFTRTSFPASSFNYDILDNGDIVAYNPSIEWVRAKIEEVGSKIGSVHFYKRSSGELRKMTYRLHVQNPSVVKKPSSNSSKDCKISSKFDIVDAITDMYKRQKRQMINNNNDQMTVYDCNKVVRDNNGVVIGRGDYRTIPLDRVVRIKSNGRTFEIVRSDMVDVG